MLLSVDLRAFFCIKELELSNILLDKYKEFSTVVDYSFRYEFEDGSKVSYQFNKKNFPHLIGIQKLIDIPIIADFNNKNKPQVSAGFIVSRIKNEKFLTDAIIRNSIYFGDIEERYDKFGRDNLLTLSYTDAIVDFNARQIKSVLKSKYNCLKIKDRDLIILV